MAKGWSRGDAILGHSLPDMAQVSGKRSCGVCRSWPTPQSSPATPCLGGRKCLPLSPGTRAALGLLCGSTDSCSTSWCSQNCQSSKTSCARIYSGVSWRSCIAAPLPCTSGETVSAVKHHLSSEKKKLIKLEFSQSSRNRRRHQLGPTLSGEKPA